MDIIGKDLNPEKKIRIAYLLQQYHINATKKCLRELVSYIPLGALISDKDIDKLGYPNFDELTRILIDGELLSKLSS